MKDILHLLTKKDWPSIVRLANKNDAHAQYMMGVAYLAGGPVKIDVASSYLWFTRAASSHGEAAFRAGALLQEYSWDNKPDIKPSYWYEISASHNSPEGMTALGNIWTFSKLSDKHWYDKWLSFKDLSVEATRTYNLYDKASSLKYAPAYYFKAIHLFKGWGCIKSKTNAIEALKNGALLDDKDCIYFLSQALGAKHEDYIMYVTKAAENGHPDAQYALSMSLLSSYDESLNQQSVTWLRRAAIQRHVKAIYRLALLYHTGRGVTCSYKESYIWAARAKQLGLNTDKLLVSNWNKLSLEEQNYFNSPVYDIDQEEFFKLSNNLFSRSGFQF